MKKISVTIFLIILAANVFSQIISPKEYYLQKSQRQRHVGWVLLGAGTVMATLSIFVDNSSEHPGEYGRNFNTSDWMFATGVTTDVASIPFFISSSVNARKAVKISLTNQHIQPAPGIPITKRYPAITLRLRLK